MYTLSTEKKLSVLSALVEGNSLRSIKCIAFLSPRRCASPMKSVSWEVAFRKLKEWEGREISIAKVEPMRVQGETISTFRTVGGSRLKEADPSTGKVTFEHDPEISLVGASFAFSDFDDSPFVESIIGSMDDAEEQLEITFPDGRMLVLAKRYEFNS